jgi:hypothetical protein
MFHPWRCKRGHGNRSDIPPEAQEGPRRPLVFRCAEPGCEEHTSIFAGSSKNPPPGRARRVKPTGEK